MYLTFKLQVVDFSFILYHWELFTFSFVFLHMLPYFFGVLISNKLMKFDFFHINCDECFDIRLLDFKVRGLAAGIML